MLCQIPDAFGEYTDHGIVHSVRVFELGEQLLGSMKLSPWETAVFTLSCFFHDIGMVCPQEDWADLEASEEFKREQGIIREFVLPHAQLVGSEATIRIQTITEFLRRHHGTRGRDWIIANRSADDESSYLDRIYIWDQVARVSISHTLDVSQIEADASYKRSSPVGTAKGIDVLLLTCLLRLSDVCHLSRDRALPYVRKSKRFTSGLSESIWKAHGDIAGVVVDEARSVIMVRAESSSFERHRMIHGEVLAIRRELDNSHRLLAGGDRSFAWKFVDSSQVRPASGAKYVYVEAARFRLIEDKIVDLLMGSRLYAEPLYAIRECIQNSLDAISVVRLEQPDYEGSIVITFSEAADERFVEIFDTGTGMDQRIVLDHLLAAGSRSFVESERRAREWGELREGTHFIARHGIGFLSCFMIAAEIEVFSLYRRGLPIRVRMDSPTRNVEFIKTDGVDGFPTWSEAGLPMQTPWQGGHGTCVRLSLADSIELNISDLMEFLASNIPRVRTALFVVHERQAVRLRESWRKELLPAWHRAEATGLLELEREFFGDEPPASTFYDGPPKDPSQQRGMMYASGIRGFVAVGDERVRRITQDGILIREGALGVWSYSREGRTEDAPFTFDVDVTGSLQLDLDAERARVIQSEPNRLRCKRICDWIEENGLASLAALEATLFFPCGGVYYHGGADLLQGHGSPGFHFHESLQRWYRPDRFREVVARFGKSPFLSAKLYVLLGAVRNEPVSMDELESEEQYLLALGKGWVFGAADETVFDDRRSRRRLRARWESFLDELEKRVGLDELLLVPDVDKCFMLPLLHRYSVVSGEQMLLNRASLINLRRRPEWVEPDEDELSRMRSLLADGGREI